MNTENSSNIPPEINSVNPVTQYSTSKTSLRDQWVNYQENTKLSISAVKELTPKKIHR